MCGLCDRVCHVTTTEKPPPKKDTWEAANLRALLAQAKDPKTGGRLTQGRLAELAGIERSRLNGLLRANSRITLTYAERLAPHLGVKKPERLLPPERVKKTPRSPLALLEELATTVDRQQGEIEELQRRVETLENSGGKSQPARKASR